MTEPGRASARWLYLVPLAVFLVVAGASAGMLLLNKNPSDLPSVLIDQPVPQFELPPVPELDRPGFTSADLVAPGQVALVNVFASWCSPCRVEHPLLTRLAEDEGVPICAINWKNEADRARAFLDELGNPFTAVGFDHSGRVGIDWGVYGVPETYVIDGEGRIRYKHAGPLTARDLEDTLLPLIQSLGG